MQTFEARLTTDSAQIGGKGSHLNTMRTTMANLWKLFIVDISLELLVSKKPLMGRVGNTRLEWVIGIAVSGLCAIRYLSALDNDRSCTSSVGTLCNWISLSNH